MRWRLLLAAASVISSLLWLYLALERRVSHQTTELNAASALRLAG